MYCLWLWGPTQFSSLCSNLEQRSNLIPGQNKNMRTMLRIWTHGGWDPMLKSTPSKGLVGNRHVKLHWQFDIRELYWCGSQHIERAVDAVRNQGLMDHQAAEQYNIPKSSLFNRLSEWVLLGAVVVYQNTSLMRRRVNWRTFWYIGCALVGCTQSFQQSIRRRLSYTRAYLSMWPMAGGILSSVATQSPHFAHQLQYPMLD